LGLYWIMEFDGAPNPEHPMKSYDVTYAKIFDGKTFWPVIGKAFEGENGRIDVRLDCMPMPQFWTDARLVLFSKEVKK
jgi:hypothetical protein